MVRALVPGERDRGVRLQYTYDWFKLMAAVINGNFTNDSLHHGTFDQTSWKDVVGRVQATSTSWSSALSVHVGRFLRLTRPVTTAIPVAGYERYRRLRLGGDTQIYADVPGLGGLTLRGELIWAKDTQMDFAGVPAATNKCKDLGRLGWSGTLVQNLGDYVGVVVRRAINTTPPTASILRARTARSRSPVRPTRSPATALGCSGYISGNLKATLVYEHLAEQDAKTVDNDILTLQLQAKF